MNIIDRIGQYLDYKGISKYKFYKITGLSNGFLDKNSNIGSDKCEKIIYAFPDISANWLLTGVGDMLNINLIHKDEQNKELEAHYSEGEGIPLIPLDAMAGFGSGNSQTIMEYECEKYIVPSFTGAEFLIKVTGNSMFPKYYSGDVVACRKVCTGTFFQWNKVYVIDSEQGVLIKRVKKSTSKDKITLVSENSEYDPFEVSLTDINSLAIVVGLIRIE